METPSSPGPWTIRSDSDGNHVCDAAGCLIIDGKDRPGIARVVRNSNGDTELDGNARKMAAALAMYDTLNAIFSDCENYLDGDLGGKITVGGLLASIRNAAENATAIW